MNRRTLAALVALVVSLPVNSRAAAPVALVTDASELRDATPARMPIGIANAPTTVMVELAGDPVAVAAAVAVVPLSRDQKELHKERLRAAQAPIEDEVRARGGVVLGSYQSAYNGVKVRIGAQAARELAALPGVVAVRPVQLFTPDNTRGVPLVGGPAVWGGIPGLHGEGVKVAIIDTGIDYTHADFGGPGTAAAYAAAHAAETAPADPALFGPAAAKVKGGVDLVGDDYDAAAPAGSPRLVPHPDANPLDCNGHGSHVAGTTAGFGVLSDGSTYTGRYDATTVSANSWLVGPGVAPRADLYAVRVFGCSGSTDVTVDAIDWAVDHDMDVINMSLGSPFGRADDPSAVAASNAAAAGLIVVASAGNSGPSPYITGSPATGPGAISVAASDPTPSFPGASLALGTGKTLAAIDANGATFADGTTVPVVVLRSGSSIALGCSPSNYDPAVVAGKLVVTARGTCARVARAIYGQKAGAAAVLMVNNAASYPPFEGKITSNPDTGEAYTVTIPFLGVPSTAAATMLAADGSTVTLTAAPLANPTYLAVASFSSGGPRSGDSGLKPEVTAPGVAIMSVAIGTGNLGEVLSGTSMAAPHTTGVAALVRQAHPGWRPAYLKAALVNTADPALVTGYQTRLAGVGLVQAQRAVATQVVAVTTGGDAALSFGFVELDRDLRAHREIKLRNLGDRAATFDVAVAGKSGSPHALAPRTTRVTVRPHEDAEVGVELTVPAATAGDASAFSDVSGLVTFTPVGGSNGGVALRVPYYAVPVAVSHVATKLDVEALLASGSATATVTNRKGAIGAAADWYAWGLAGKRTPALGSNDLRAVGVQRVGNFLVFAVSTFKRWSNPAQNEFDVFLDVNGDGQWDYAVVGVDLGALTAGSYSGVMTVAVFMPNGKFTRVFNGIGASTDSTTVLLPVFLPQLCRPGLPCLSATNPRFTYWAAGFGWDGTADVIPATASFNAFTPAVSTGMFDFVAPDTSVTETVAIDPAELAHTPPLGLMIVTTDNPAVGEDGNEAQLVRFGED